MRQGSTVRLIQPVVQGEVKARRINDLTDELELLVEWQEETDDGVHTVQRWFEADRLEEVQL